MMNLKSLLIVCFVIIYFSRANAQNFAVDKGATTISGIASFANKSGALYKGYDSKNSTMFSISPLANHFIFKNIFVGVGGDYIHETGGVYSSTNTYTVGPQIGYAYGDENSAAFPYLSIGGRYMWAKYDHNDPYFQSKTNGTDFFASLGVIVPIKDHVGLIFQGSYHMIRQRYESDFNEYEYDKNGSVVSLGIGIAGLLY